jgi:hypothetical protein
LLVAGGAAALTHERFWSRSSRPPRPATTARAPRADAAAGFLAHAARETGAAADDAGLPDRGARADVADDANAADDAGRAPASRPAGRRPVALRRRARAVDVVVQSRLGSTGPPVWGEVYLDGVLRGRTPITLPRVPVGVHVVEVRRAGYRTATQRVVLRPGARAVVSLVLRAR